MLLCFFFLVCSLAIEIKVTQNRVVPSNANPGVKLALTQKTFDYMIQKVVPVYEKELTKIQIPDIHQNVGTPIGTISLDLTSFKIQTLNIALPSLTIVSTSEFSFSDPHISGHISGNWHYKDHDFPWPEDSGSFDLNLDVGVTVHFGAVVDPSHKSGVRVVTDGTFNLGWNGFDLELHGGASWLYNLLIGAFKGDIEGLIASTVKSQVPPIIIQQAQQFIDSLDLEIEIMDNVFFDFVVDHLTLNPSQKYVSAGVDGSFQTKSLHYTGTPTSMPDCLSTDSMISIYLSSWSVDSAGYVFDEVGALQFILTQSEVPSSWPFKLETTWFKVLAPEIVTKFGDKPMQITFVTDKVKIPSVRFDQISGVSVQVSINSEFQVMNDKTPTTAFTIQLDLGCNATVSVNKIGDNYVINGKVSLIDLNTTLTQSAVGKVNVDGMASSLQFIAKEVVLPIINQMLGKRGVPLPSIPYFTLVNPDVTIHNEFLEVKADFTFSPPPPKELEFWFGKK